MRREAIKHAVVLVTTQMQRGGIVADPVCQQRRDDHVVIERNTDRWACPSLYLASMPGCYLSRLADNMEAEQLGLAADLVEEAKRILDGCKWTPGELHLLTEALTDVHRVAESRGARLADPAWDDPDVIDDEDEDDPARPVEASA
ncbi:hypothetical protein [Streptomyces mirabilis]|uniref:hypothetical protein n=1 Tax=Streptomyces mirabilis TaxID=68239 RepID=UPI0036787BFB